MFEGSGRPTPPAGPGGADAVGRQPGDERVPNCYSHKRGNPVEEVSNEEICSTGSSDKPDSGEHTGFVCARGPGFAQSVPAAPTNLAGATASGQVKLGWDDPGDSSISSYDYRVGTTATDGTTTWSPDWTSIAGSDATTVSHTATGLADGTSYTFQVRAVNTTGPGAAPSTTAILNEP